MTITIRKVDYHRNGISGEGFHVVHFTDPDEGEMIGVVFAPDNPSEFHNPRVAVFKEELLPDTTFGSNSWRGDNYANKLYRAIPLWDEVEREKSDAFGKASIAELKAIQARLTI